MITGLLSGIFWALDTVIIGIALSSAVFNNSKEIILFAPFISTFLHDFSSSIWLLIYVFIKRQFNLFKMALLSKAGRFIALGAIFGGPIGMSCYIAAIKNIGPGYTAVISSMYPALGAFFAHIFLKEKMNLIQILGLVISILGIIVLGYNPVLQEYNNFTIGIVFAVLCCVGWASEAVICAYGMRDPNVNNEQALQIRQLISAISYIFIIILVLDCLEYTVEIIKSEVSPIIIIAALCGTVSYLCYYKAIMVLGAAKAMPLNITYSAWAILFSLIFLQVVPDIKSIVCGVVIIIGSIIASTDIYKILKNF